jgi:pilus assembly protein CpaC
MDLPYLGAAFRNTQSRINEVELLIMVRPELVEAMDPDQVPCCGPGMNSQSPDECGLYWKGYIETPVQPYGRQGHGPNGYGPGPMGHENEVPGNPEQVDPTPAPQAEEIPMTRAPVRPKTTVVVSDKSAASSRRPAYAQQPPTQPTRSGSYNPSNRQARKPTGPTNSGSDPPGFIGPIGYDVQN